MTKKKPPLAEIAKKAAAWALKKYGKRDASYMLACTHEVTEGFLQEYWPTLTEKETKTILSKADKILS